MPTTEATSIQPFVELDQELHTGLARLDAIEESAAQVSNQERLRAEVEAFRLLLDWFLGMYRKYAELDCTWRTQVFRGEVAVLAEQNFGHRALFSLWNDMSRIVLERAEYYLRHGANFGGQLAQLDGYSREVRQTLRTWRAPAPSQALALRTLRLTQTQAQKLEEILTGSN